jgi:hypothetical protein
MRHVLAETRGLETDQLLLDKVSKQLPRRPSAEQSVQASLGLFSA